jgi:hypothetical protein
MLPGRFGAATFRKLPMRIARGEGSFGLAIAVGVGGVDKCAAGVEESAKHPVGLAGEGCAAQQHRAQQSRLTVNGPSDAVCIAPGSRRNRLIHGHGKPTVARRYGAHRACATRTRTSSIQDFPRAILYAALPVSHRSLAVEQERVCGMAFAVDLRNSSNLEF